MKGFYRHFFRYGLCNTDKMVSKNNTNTARCKEQRKYSLLNTISLIISLCLHIYIHVLDSSSAVNLDYSVYIFMCKILRPQLNHSLILKKLHMELYLHMTSAGMLHCHCMS